MLLINKLNIMQKIEIKKKKFTKFHYPLFVQNSHIQLHEFEIYQNFYLFRFKLCTMIYILIKLPDIKTVKYLYYCRFDQSNKVFPKQVETRKRGVLQRHRIWEFSHSLFKINPK